MTDHTPSEARCHRAIINSAVEFAIIATDCDGRVTDWNTGAERILGWSAAEMRGELADRVFTPEDQVENGPATEMRLASETGRASDERWHLRKDSSRFWASSEMVLLRDDDGAHLGFLKILRDRTDQLQATAAQQADAEFLRSVLASSADCIKVLDLDAKLVFMSEGGQRVMEVSDFNAIRGCSWPDFWQDEGNADARAAVAAAKAGRTGHFQGPAQTMAGTPRYWDVQVTPILGADGQPVKLLSVSRDITERRRLETELRHINANLEQRVAAQTADRNRLWQLSTDIMVVAQFDGIIMAVNPAWAITLGWTGPELVGCNLSELIHPEDLDRSAYAARTLAEGSTLRRFDNRYRHKDGSYRWIAWMAVPGDGLINAVGRDVTAEREQAKALRQAEAQLRQSQKMEAVSNLSGGMAHDSNNMLGVIIGSLDLIVPLVKDNPEVAELVEEAISAAVSSAELNSRLLAFARKQTLRPERIVPNDLISGIVRLLRRTLGENIEIVLDLSNDLWPIIADSVQLQASLTNLATNARDAMPNGGRLSITTANQYLDAEYAALNVETTAGDYAAIEVSDTGTGMTPEVVQHVFEPFYTTKDPGKGTGLGLSMVFGFIKQSGGHISVYSEPGVGTTFRLYLPRAADETGPAAMTRSVLSVHGAGESVLAVEDSPKLRQVVMRQLSELGYNPIEADGPVAALAILERRKIDLLFTDVVMPGPLNGIALARQVLERWPTVKVALTSGFAGRTFDDLADAQGVPLHLISKPYRLTELATLLRRVLRG